MPDTKVDDPNVGSAHAVSKPIDIPGATGKGRDTTDFAGKRPIISSDPSTPDSIQQEIDEILRCLNKDTSNELEFSMDSSISSAPSFTSLSESEQLEGLIRYFGNLKESGGRTSEELVGLIERTVEEDAAKAILQRIGELV